MAESSALVPSGTLTVHGGVPREEMFSREQQALILSTVAKGATPDQFKLFLYQCYRTKLDPLCRQIYAVIRGGALSIQVSIDGFRVIALRSGLYAGREPTQWCNKEGIWVDIWLDASYPPSGAKVGVRVKNGAGGYYVVWAVATLRSYSTGQGLWPKMPDVMLEKCAEAKALRAAFPHDLSGLYSAEEMEQASSDR